MRILCLTLLHLTKPPLLCEPMLFTTLDQTVLDSLLKAGHDTTKWRFVVNETYRKCFLHKNTTSHFPHSDAGLFTSSSQVLFGLPALVVTLFWGSSVDPAPTSCYSHYSFLAWLFMFSAALFFS